MSNLTITQLLDSRRLLESVSESLAPKQSQPKRETMREDDLIDEVDKP